MTFESKLKEYFKKNHYSNSDDVVNSGLNAKRRAEVFALAQSSCEAETSETYEGLKEYTMTDKSVQKLKNSSSKKKSRLLFYLPFAMAAIVLLAVVPVIIMKQTIYTQRDMQSNISQVKEDKSTVSNSDNTLTTERTKQSDKILAYNSISKTLEPISTEESEALALTRQIMEGNIDMPAYEGDVSPHLQAQPTLVGNESDDNSGMVIHITEEYLESINSR